MRPITSLVLLVLTACGSSPASDGPPPSSSTASAVTLPKLGGDCLSYFNDDGSRVPVDIGTLGLEAANCSSGDSICLLVGSTPQPSFAMISLDLPLDLYESGEALSLDENAPHVKLNSVDVAAWL